LRAAHAGAWGLLVVTAAALGAHVVYEVAHERRLRVARGPGHRRARKR
jgi:hypothetical protein